jgi:hypothetical protein
MSLAQNEPDQSASSRYTVSVIGNDAVFLVDRLLGHMIYMGANRRLTRAEIRRIVVSLDYELSTLTTTAFAAKHGLHA